MIPERAAFLTQMVEVFTSTVSFGERLNNMVHLLARHLNLDLALYFGLDKARETLVLNFSSQGPVAPPHRAWNLPMGAGLVGEAAASRKYRVVHRNQPGVAEVNAVLEKLNPAYQTLAAFPVSDDNFLYGVLLLMDRQDRPITPAERQNIQLVCLMLAGTLRQAIVQEDAKKRIAELSVLFEVGKALSSTVELDELLERIVSTTAKVITARGAALDIIDSATGEIRVSSRYGHIPPECRPFSLIPRIPAGPGSRPTSKGNAARRRRPHPLLPGGAPHLQGAAAGHLVRLRQVGSRRPIRLLRSGKPPASLYHGGGGGQRHRKRPHLPAGGEPGGEKRTHGAEPHHPAGDLPGLAHHRAAGPAAGDHSPGADPGAGFGLCPGYRLHGGRRDPDPERGKGARRAGRSGR